MGILYVVTKLSSFAPRSSPGVAAAAIGKRDRQLMSLLCIVIALALLTGCESSRHGSSAKQPSEVSTLDLSAREPVRSEGQGADNQPPDAAAPVGYQMFPGEGAAIGRGLRRDGGITPAGQDYNLSFDNANLPDVARMVLGEVLKVPYIIDPKVQGTVTLSTGSPVTRDELLNVLESALQMNDAALVYDGQQYKVVPGSVLAGGTPNGSFDIANRGQATPPGYGVTVLPLRHVQAVTVMGLLEGFISRSGLVRAASRGNLLLLRGTAQERDALIGIARSFDVDAMSSQSAAIAVLRNSAPEEIIPHLRKVSQTDPDPQATSLVRFEPLPRLNAILILAPDKSQVNEALAWVTRLDQPTEEGASYYIYRVQNAKASSLTRILNDAFGQGAASASASEPDQRRSQSGPSSDARTDGMGGMAPQEQGSDAPTTPAPVEESGVDLTGPQDGGPAVAGEGVRITANNSTNSLIIRAPARIYRQILGILRQIDKPSVQVLINVMIAEVTLTDNLRYGVEAYLEKQHFTVLDATQLPLEPALPGLNILIGKADGPKAVLDALSAVTNVKVVSSPSVVTLDNQMATIKVGNQVPITTQQAVSTQTSNAPLVNSIEYRDSGVILRVTPRVSETDLVTMDISQELSAVVAPSNGGTSLTPTLSQRIITSTIAVYNRQTVVLGGLISSQDSKDKQSIPLVNQIPVLGDLLSKQDNKTTRTELVVFITPKVMRDAIDASRVSEEVRNALHLLNE